MYLVVQTSAIPGAPALSHRPATRGFLRPPGKPKTPFFTTSFLLPVAVNVFAEGEKKIRKDWKEGKGEWEMRGLSHHAGSDQPL